MGQSGSRTSFVGRFGDRSSGRAPKLFAGVKSLLVELREDPQHRRVICGLPCHARESGLSWHTAGETPRRQFCDDILDLCSGIFPAVVLIQIVVRPTLA